MKSINVKILWAKTQNVSTTGGTFTVIAVCNVSYSDILGHWDILYTVQCTIVHSLSAIDPHLRPQMSRPHYCTVCLMPKDVGML